MNFLTCVSFSSFFRFEFIWAAAEIPRAYFKYFCWIERWSLLIFINISSKLQNIKLFCSDSSPASIILIKFSLVWSSTWFFFVSDLKNRFFLKLVDLCLVFKIQIDEFHQSENFRFLAGRWELSNVPHQRSSILDHKILRAICQVVVTVFWTDQKNWPFRYSKHHDDSPLPNVSDSVDLAVLSENYFSSKSKKHFFI